MKYWYYIFFFWVVIAVGCDPCEDCGEPLLYDPIVSVIFINYDSAQSLQSNVDTRDEMIDELDSIERINGVTLDDLEDSLEVVNDSILADVPGYEAIRDQLQADTATTNATLRMLEAEILVLDSINDYENEIIRVIESGLIQVDRATLLETGAVLTYEDSAEVYNLPLLMDEGANQTRYEISIGEQTIDMDFLYQMENSVGVDRIFRRIATNITILASDSISEPECRNPENCVSNATTVTVYF